MGEKEIIEIASNKAIMLAESRVRCIVDNAKCIMQASFVCIMDLSRNLPTKTENERQTINLISAYIFSYHSFAFSFSIHEVIILNSPRFH